MNSMKIAAGSSNPKLAEKIAQQLNTKLIDIDLTDFPNDERRIHIREDVNGEDIAVIQSFSKPTDQHILEFLLLADAFERAGARNINLVLPWMGYSLQDKVFRGGEPIAAKVVANLVSTSYTNRVFLLDLHNTSTPGFFSIPSQHLSAQNLFADYTKDKIDLKNTVIASPDFGGLKRARVFATQLGLDLVNIDKHRSYSTGEVTAVDVHGNVENKNVIILDDIILSGSTAIEAASLLKANGAKEVYFFATHGVFVPGSLEKIASSDLDRIVITNSIAHQQLSKKIEVLDCSSIFSEALKKWL